MPSPAVPETYGTGLIRSIRERHPDARILGLDLRAPVNDAPDEFCQCDVLAPDMADAITGFAPDTMVHLAYVVDPIHDEALMGRINIDGTNNFLDAARRCSPERILVSSSATIYGAWPDNPIPLCEDSPIRPRKAFRYSSDKVVVEDAIRAFAAEHPSIAVAITRPSIIYSPGVSNYLIKFIVNAKVVVLPGGDDAAIQFVHIDDLSHATVAILEQDARGPFNVSPEDWVTLKDLARLARRPHVSVPFFLCRAWSHVWWKFDLPWFRSPASLWYFIRYPWIVTSRRLTENLNFRFRHTGQETFRMLLAERGQLRAMMPSPAPGDRAVSPTNEVVAETPPPIHEPN